MDVEAREREVPYWLSAAVAYDTLKLGYAKVMGLPLLRRLDANVTYIAENALETVGVPHENESALSTADSFIDSILEKVDDSVDTAALTLKSYAQRLRFGSSAQSEDVEPSSVESTTTADGVENETEDDKIEDLPQEILEESKAEERDEEAVAQSEALDIVTDAMTGDNESEVEDWDAEVVASDEDQTEDPLFTSVVETDCEASDAQSATMFATPGLNADEDEDEDEDEHERRILEAIAPPYNAQQTLRSPMETPIMSVATLTPTTLEKTPASSAFEDSVAADLDASW